MLALDGVLSAWIAARLPMNAALMADADIAKAGETNLADEPPFVPFVLVLDMALMRTIDQMRAGINTGRVQVVDARPTRSARRAAVTPHAHVPERAVVGAAGRDGGPVQVPRRAASSARAGCFGIQ
ncbi:hypothetical protein BC828DRAFT_398257 [Blastocladiella britannica]|nr:hypothetical protein BC828DRAFT_398257 [Blastocladiella britannica]